MIKEFHNLDEIQKYYNEESNSYIFKEYGTYINLVVFSFDLNVEANIYAWNIYGKNINAKNISALSINANNISYYAVCYAYKYIKCHSIKGRKHNAKHFVLDGQIYIDGSIETTK